MAASDDVDREFEVRTMMPVLAVGDEITALLERVRNEGLEDGAANFANAEPLTTASVVVVLRQCLSGALQFLRHLASQSVQNQNKTKREFLELILEDSLLTILELWLSLAEDC